MKILYALSLCLGLSIGLLYAQPPLSDKAQVSLITVGPGKELYSTFGHSAIRFYDPVKRVDEDFNYGTFDFRTQGFYLKFIRGQLPYLISSNSFMLESRYWALDNRHIKEQLLNLSQTEKEKLFSLLIENMQPENREYQYKFFYDNCSTRLKDILDKATNHKINYKTTLHADSSYREWIDKYARQSGKFWSDFGMDMCIGLPSDQSTGWKGAVFLPDNLHDALANASLNGEPIVKGERTIFKSKELKQGTLDFPFILLGLLSLLIGFVTFFTKKNLAIFDTSWFFILGLMGLFFWFLWWGTNHEVTQQNMSLLWAVPLWLIFSFYLKSTGLIMQFFMLFCFICNIIFISWGLFNISKLNAACLFIAIISSIRLLSIYRQNFSWKI